MLMTSPQMSVRSALPQADVPVGVTGREEDDEPGADLVALDQAAVDVGGGEGADGVGQRVGQRVVGGRGGVAGLHVGRVELADPHRDVQRGRDLPGAARVIDMGMGDHMGARGVPGQLAQDPLRAEAGARVDEHVPHEEGVDAVPRHDGDLEDVLERACAWHRTIGSGHVRHRSARGPHRGP